MLLPHILSFMAGTCAWIMAEFFLSCALPSLRETNPLLISLSRQDNKKCAWWHLQVSASLKWPRLTLNRRCRLVLRPKRVKVYADLFYWAVEGEFVGDLPAALIAHKDDTFFSGWLTWSQSSSSVKSLSRRPREKNYCSVNFAILFFSRQKT